jgi:hypothetical protein
MTTSLGSRPHNEPAALTWYIKMDLEPAQPVKDPPNLVRAGSFSLDRLLSHIDPGAAEESEDFVRLIYEQRLVDLPSDRDAQTGC